MRIYHYHPTTNILLGSSEADLSPMEPGVYLIPAYATEIVPPVEPDGQRAVFDGAAWVLEPIPVPVNHNITQSPDTLFGGPTMKDVFYGNE
jgi:hypothetical protein